MTMQWTSSSSRSWNIQIQQISCLSPWRPPDGCLQWFTGTSGYIQSFNYAGGMHLASQEYHSCIRTEQVMEVCKFSDGSNLSYSKTSDTSMNANYHDYNLIFYKGSCYIKYTPVSDQFQVV